VAQTKPTAVKPRSNDWARARRYLAWSRLAALRSSECAGFARDPAKVEDQVRLLARTLRGKLETGGWKKKE